MHATTLAAAGYSFWVLPRAFVTHVPHAHTRANHEWARDVGGHKRRMDELFEAQMAREAKSEQSEQDHGRGGSCARTLACKVPLVQFIDPLEEAAYAGRRAPAEILA